MITISDIKHAARGREVELLEHVALLPSDILKGQHHPCPDCGGKDRFRLINANAGAVLCNQCFDKKNGDFLSAIQHYRDITLPEAITLSADYLNIKPHQTKKDIISSVAHAHGLTRDELINFGAHADKRGKLNVCRLPMFDSNLNRCGWFDMSTFDDKWLKGRCGRKDDGSIQGLFLPSDWTLRTSETVYVVEGPKDAAKLHSLGYRTIGLPGKKFPKGTLELLAGLDVVIIPDRDEPGEDAAAETVSLLTGISTTTRVATLPGEKTKTGGAGVREILSLPNGEELLRQAIESARPIKESLKLTRFPDGRDTVFSLDYYGHEISGLTTAELIDPKKLISRISEVTHPRQDPVMFADWWCGVRSRKKGPRIDGVYRRLLEEAENAKLIPSESRRAFLANWLLNYLEELANNRRPSEANSDVWTYFDNGIGAKWKQTEVDPWGTALRREYSRLLKDCGASESKRDRKRVFVFDHKAMSRLRSIAGVRPEDGLS